MNDVEIKARKFKDWLDLRLSSYNVEIRECDERLKMLRNFRQRTIDLMGFLDDYSLLDYLEQDADYESFAKRVSNDCPYFPSLPSGNTVFGHHLKQFRDYFDLRNKNKAP